MFKKFFSKYKVEMLEAYLAASVCFLASSMGWISIAIIIGFVNTYLLNPLIVTFKFGNRADYKMFEMNHMRAFKNVAKALLISFIIVMLYNLIDRYLFPTFVEPITFGILFKVIDILLGKLFSYKKNVSKE